MTSQQLRSKIENKGLKQKFVAARLNVSEGLISQWMKGTTPIPQKHLTKLITILK